MLLEGNGDTMAQFYSVCAIVRVRVFCCSTYLLLAYQLSFFIKMDEARSHRSTVGPVGKSGSVRKLSLLVKPFVTV